ncbi:MAG: hypothetical protein QXZ09_02105 [Candidatus Methanomethylicaceae archaeon]
MPSVFVPIFLFLSIKSDGRNWSRRYRIAKEIGGKTLQEGREEGTRFNFNELYPLRFYH